MKGYLRPFQRIVRLYRDSKLRREEKKDDSPFRHKLAGCETHTSHWSEISWPATLTTTPRRCFVKWCEILDYFIL